MLKPLAIPAASGFLQGVLQTPAEWDGSYARMAILLPGLAGTRVGPHRILYDLSSLIASRGVVVLRCDLSGRGYSDRAANGPSTLSDQVRDVHDLIDYCEITFGARRFMLGGICRGARVALAASIGSSRIEQLMLLSCTPLHGESLERKAARRRFYHMGKYAAKFVSMQWLPRLLTGDLNLGLIARIIARPVDTKGLERLNASEGIDFHLLEQRMIFLYGGKDPDRKNSIRYYSANLMGRAPGKISIHVIPDSDAGFYSAQWHREVLLRIGEWLGR